MAKVNGTKVYNKKGEEFNVVHPIDVKGWLDTGYSKTKPSKAKADAEAKAENGKG